MIRRRLYRSRSGVVFGVCKGLAEWLHISETFVRIVWIALVLLTGFFPFVLLYMFMAFVMPERDFSSHDERRREYTKYY